MSYHFFLFQEVFKSDYCASSKLSQVLGKCHVMFVKDYFNKKPEVRNSLVWNYVVVK